ncbi:hypothetical protein [Thalassomonas haliotis]|uniref:Uncharacterized protein n=1 Tax=Thalassomonas haliotis TaxID=485448 RepID=A0ABY7VDK9_9GAMM|nr:hypothetical protein [Thalassomonas haliotis]WDE11750.1 hypothetical protein H3N35_26755 [Thalassomonas haliotis]
MKSIPKKTTYNTSEILESIKFINQMLFSLRDIGDYSVDAKDFDIKEEVYSFIVDSNCLDKLAYIRRILESEFEDAPREGDKAFLEVLTEDIEYWQPNKKK